MDLVSPNYYTYGLWAFDYILSNQTAFLPILMNVQPDPCEEKLVNKKVWQGAMDWSCDAANRRVGAVSLKMIAGTFSIGEMYSHLMPVEPNQTYEVSYWVKTDMEINGAEIYGRIVASQYNANTQESDELQDNRIDAGFDLGENPGLHQDWVFKSYTFATKADAAFVRIRAIMGGTTGTAKGTMWIDDATLRKR
jgi:hypothetical protein